ncbi:MAG: prepilin-type N-terminal cleavage/methylation domain-containing protein [Verrucomicrobiota bacterium]|nr:prepilin-type N-terminal cleavage/methylation domain-containing protein [Verrucomicrobiota bacterium]
MKMGINTVKGFTLLELVVVVAVIAILAASLLPVLSRTKAKAQKPACMNNLRQIGLAIRMYADDSSDAFPPAADSPPASFNAYTMLMKSYVGLTGTKPERAKLFACPADQFYWGYEKGWVSQSLNQQARFYYSSYGFNGGNFISGKPAIPRWPGIAGRKLNSINEPGKTVLVTEFAALLPYSWHEPARVSHYNNARDVMAFVDGHVSFVKMFWDATKTKGVEAWHYDPPAGYDYKWSGD